MKQYAAIVIGFGKGGKTFAGKLGSSGKSAAMIEKSDRMYGGTCIKVGIDVGEFAGPLVVEPACGGNFSAIRVLAIFAAPVP